MGVQGIPDEPQNKRVKGKKKKRPLLGREGERMQNLGRSKKS